MLTRDQVREFLKKVMVKVPRGNGPKDRPRGGKEAARAALTVLRKAINWGIREGLISRSDNPLQGMEANLPKKRRRDRVLSLEEARLAWVAAGTLGYPFGPVYQLMMLTGCRPGEWSKAVRPWIDLSQSLSVIPADRYKTDHVHVVPLVSQSVRILEDVFLNHQTRSGEYVFSGNGRRASALGMEQGSAALVACNVRGERRNVCQEILAA